GAGTGTTTGDVPVNVNVHVDNTIDWGENPGTKAPELTPDTPESFITPLWDIWPAARDFKLHTRNVPCPVFDIPAFGRMYKLDSHCQIMERNDIRSLISVIFPLIYAVVVIGIILSA
ncbi:TPA: hypothetical protein J1404_004879, partial [Escherichia coli]|nr:hypothetical protein [Escherichia coli]